MALRISKPAARVKRKAKVPVARTEPGEDAIRIYAYQLYAQSNRAPGQAVDNWLEAKACLKANIPSHQARTRLHRHVNGPA